MLKKSLKIGLITSILLSFVYAKEGEEGVISSNPRISKPFSASLGYGLLGFAPAANIRGSYAITPEWEAGVFYAAGGHLGDIFKEAVNKNQNKVTVTKFTMDSSLFLVEGRYFFGETFAINMGLGYGSWNIDLDANWKKDKNEINGKAQLDFTRTVASVGVSNHWVWDNGIMVSADWIDLILPLVSNRKIKNASIAGLKISDANKFIDDLGGNDAKEVKDFINMFEKLPWLRMMFSVGYRF